MKMDETEFPHAPGQWAGVALLLVREGQCHVPRQAFISTARCRSSTRYE